MKERKNNMAGRIIEHLDTQGITVKAFAAEIGISPSTIIKSHQTGRSLQGDILEKFALKFKDVDARYILTGEKTQVIDVLSDIRIIQSNTIQVLEDRLKDKEELIKMYKEKIIQAGA